MLFKTRESFVEWAIRENFIRDFNPLYVYLETAQYPIYIDGMGDSYFTLTGTELRKLAVDVFAVMGELYQS
jgi:hypothetical protein